MNSPLNMVDNEWFSLVPISADISNQNVIQIDTISLGKQIRFQLFSHNSKTVFQAEPISLELNYNDIFEVCFIIESQFHTTCTSSGQLIKSMCSFIYTVYFGQVPLTPWSRGRFNPSRVAWFFLIFFNFFFQWHQVKLICIGLKQKHYKTRFIHCLMEQTIFSKLILSKTIVQSNKDIF